MSAIEPPSRRGRERGSLTIFFSVLMFFLVAITLVAYEGGRRLANISRAEDLASEAARAAASTIRHDSLSTARPLIDDIAADGARHQAEAIVATGESSAWIADFQISDSSRTVSIVVQIDAESWLPGFDISGRGSHTAQVIDPTEVP